MTGALVDSLEEPLLQPLGLDRRPSRWDLVVKSFWAQMRIAVPLTVNLVTIRTVATINLMLVTVEGGTQQLAATALGNMLSIMFAKLILMGLCGGLDTQAAQAFGARKLSLLPVIFQRCLLFLLLHSFGICAVLLAVPKILLHVCTDPALGQMAGKFVLFAIPSVWLDALGRPLNRMLVAQGLSTPLMVISLIEVPILIAANWYLVLHTDLQYIGCAVALSFSSALDFLLTLGYVILSNRASVIIGKPTKLALKGWSDFARLSYPACFMKCAESWAFTLMTLVASLLPDPSVAVAAVGVAFNVYGILYMVYLACCMAACTQVGNCLGAGNAEGAEAAALAAIAVSPLAWSIAAVGLLVPACQTYIINFFKQPGVDSEHLETVLRHLLYITAALVLLDGTQTIMSGVIQGLGAQRRGAAVNGVAFYCCAVPLSLFFAFKLHLGPEGLYLGMVTGPLIQVSAYSWMLLKTDWQYEARLANARQFGVADPTLVKGVSDPEHMDVAPSLPEVVEHMDVASPLPEGRGEKQDKGRTCPDRPSPDLPNSAGPGQV